MTKVACIMLVNGREEMARRALASWNDQDYPHSGLLVLDSGKERINLPVLPNVAYERRSYHNGASIGALRNFAISYALGYWPDAEIIAHFDSDDWYHPSRLSEQVQLLCESGQDCVGYNEVLFYDSTKAEGEAWLYSQANPALPVGASLAYWASAWRKTRFPDQMIGEDLTWLLKVKAFGVSSLGGRNPRMIASVHGGNTSSRVGIGHKEWTRAKDFDALCRDRMKL